MNVTQLDVIKNILIVGVIGTATICIFLMFFRDKLKKKILRFTSAISLLMLLVVITIGILSLIYSLTPKSSTNKTAQASATNTVVAATTPSSSSSTGKTPLVSPGIPKPSPGAVPALPNAEILNCKIVPSTKGENNLGNRVAYSIKNNLTKEIESCTVAIFIYDKDKNPLTGNTKSTGYPDNMIEESSYATPENPVVIKPAITLNANEVKDAISDATLSDNVKYVKMIITEIKYKGETQTWINPENDNAFRNSDKF